MQMPEATPRVALVSSGPGGKACRAVVILHTPGTRGLGTEEGSPLHQHVCVYTTLCQRHWMPQTSCFISPPKATVIYWPALV